MVYVNDIHVLQQFLGLTGISQGKVKTCIGQRQAWTADDTNFIVRIIGLAKRKYIHVVSSFLKVPFVQVDIICDAANVGLVSICHHANAHGSAFIGYVGIPEELRSLQSYGMGERLSSKNGVEWVLLRIMVKLILRDKEYEVKPGMTLLSALQKCGILSESVIATREGELILDDEILNDGEVVKLVAVISGG